MSQGESKARNYFVHTLLRAREWQHRPEFDQVCDWWREGGRGVCALVGMGGAGKTAITERFLRMLPGGLPADPNVPKDQSMPSSPGTLVFSFYEDNKPENFLHDLQMWLQGSARGMCPSNELEQASALSRFEFRVAILSKPEV